MLPERAGEAPTEPKHKTRERSRGRGFCRAVCLRVVFVFAQLLADGTRSVPATLPSQNARRRSGGEGEAPAEPFACVSFRVRSAFGGRHTECACHIAESKRKTQEWWGGRGSCRAVRSRIVFVFAQLLADGTRSVPATLPSQNARRRSGREGEASAEPFACVSFLCLLSFWRTAHGVCLPHCRVKTQDAGVVGRARLLPSRSLTYRFCVCSAFGGRHTECACYFSCLGVARQAAGRLQHHPGRPELARRVRLWPPRTASKTTGHG